MHLIPFLAGTDNLKVELQRGRLWHVAGAHAL